MSIEQPNELAQMRQQAGVTQEQVARLLELSGKTPYNWEHLPNAKIKAYQRIAYRAAIEEARQSVITGGYSSPAQMAA